MTPLAIDLFCGLGGWTEGLLAEGYRVVGFDIERHVYGEHAYPAQLVLQDVLTIHGSQFKDAALIVASPPCQGYSYRAMPWKRAKALPPPDNSLFEACFRIQREASEAKGEHIPLVVENVRGAQKYVGRARYHFGSFYLWGDMPALMPMTRKAIKVPTMGAGWYPPEHPKHVKGLAFNGPAARLGRRTDVGNGVRFTSRDCGIEKGSGNNGEQGRDLSVVYEVADQVPSAQGRMADRFLQPDNHCLDSEGVKHKDRDGYERTHPEAFGWKSPRTSSGATTARKAASAMIAKIPLVLARHIAKVYKPAEYTEAVS